MSVVSLMSLWAEERPEEPPEEIRLGDIEEARRIGRRIGIKSRLVTACASLRGASGHVVFLDQIRSMILFCSIYIYTQIIL